MYIRQQIKPADISPSPGWLGDIAATPAEAVRLKDEMEKLAVKNTWSGVERSYQDWLKLNVVADWEVYRLAAYAARALCCGTAYYLRLILALGANPPPDKVQEITDEKLSIERRWAHVDIRLRRKAKGDLQPVGGLPLDPSEARTIRRAQKELKEKGKFDDLLPAISYTIDGYPVSLGSGFAISSGVSVVNIDQKGDGSFQLKLKPGPWNYSRASDECKKNCCWPPMSQPAS